MTSPASSGSPSRRRIAGIALVGVGVIAAIIGLATLTLGGGNGGAVAAPPSSATPSGEANPGAAPLTGQPTVAPPTDSSAINVPTFPTTTVAVAAPPTAAPPAGADQGGAGSGSGAGGAGSGVGHGPIRVYNNSTIKDLAAGAAADFRAAGWDVTGVDNYPFGVIPVTTAYYRPGTAEKATAEELGHEFGMRVTERFEGLQDASPGVIVIVTNNYRGK